MFKLSPFLCLLMVVIAGWVRPASLLAQNTSLEQIFAEKGEVYFTFDIQNRSEIAVLTRIISIDNVQGNQVFAFANQNGFEQFLELAYPYTILPAPSDLYAPKMVHNSADMLNNWDAYPTYDAYVALMEGFVTAYPNLCRLVNIGTLPSGRQLLVLKITDNIDIAEGKPQFLYTSSMHGDETAGYVGMLHYIDYLLSRYGTDNRVTYLVDHMEIWINPLANPDGTYKGGNNTVSGATRSNANNVDLNRNYPDFEDGPHPDGNAWQPETVAFMGFADTMNFVMAANFHGGAEVINYPWDTKPGLPADVDWWINESAEYADTAFLHSPDGYLTSVTPTGYVNGYAWYEVNGGRQDYMNYYHQCREMTIELSDTKLLEETNLLSNWEYNYRSWLNYMEEALNGIRGVVKDACTGQPIVAQVTVDGLDTDNAFVKSAKKAGNYHRPILPGTYTLTFSAPGYISQTVSGVTVLANTPATVLDIQLEPAVPVAGFTASSTYVCGDEIAFFDQTGSATSWLWSFGDGSTSTEQNPVHHWMAGGSYTVSLVVTNCAGQDTLVKMDYVTLNLPEAPQVVGASGCSGTSMMLVAFGQGMTNWYDAPSGGNLLSGEPGFITPPLTTTTTYYVESDQSNTPEMVGPQDNTIGTGGFYTGGTYHYLSFNAIAPFRLLSVWVNANTAGNRTIQLRTAGGTVIQSATINIPAGQGRVDLNFAVPEGEGLQLGVAGTNNLFRNQTGAAYPYEVDGVVSIFGNSAGNAAIYYYFYDWEIQQQCTSPRTPVTATVLPTPVPPVVTLVDNNLVSSVDVGNQWYNVATGLIAGATGSVLLSPLPGSYYVVLTDANGCTAASEVVTFVPTGTNDGGDVSDHQVLVYPNPANDQVYVTCTGFDPSKTSLTLLNVLGQQVLYLEMLSDPQVRINSAALPSGVYWVKVSDGQGRVVCQKIILE